MTEPGAGSAFFRMNGAGENLSWSAADFENFLEPRPDLAPTMERDLEKIVELLATNEWPFRIHATYDESIDRFLTVFERVNQKQPFKRSEEHTSELQSLMRISYAVFCLKKKKKTNVHYKQKPIL